jgi:hypothetical protein
LVKTSNHVRQQFVAELLFGCEEVSKMLRRLRRIRDVIRERFPESRLDPLSAEQVAAVKRRHPKVPAEVLKFFEIVGCGSIGPSRYMVYALIDATEIFGEGCAAELGGVVLIGDDFSGQHEGYDTKNGWQFGTVGGNARFEPHSAYHDFAEFIERWFVEE